MTEVLRCLENMLRYCDITAALHTARVNPGHFVNKYSDISYHNA